MVRFMNPSLEFFGTSAQVLPTLAIAIILADRALVDGSGTLSGTGRVASIRLRSVRGNLAFWTLLVGELGALSALWWWPVEGVPRLLLGGVVGAATVVALCSIIPAGVVVVRRRRSG